MPAKRPFYSCTLGNRLLLKALHEEMKEKDIITQTLLHNHSDPVTSSSGIHSNSLSEDSEEEKYFGSLSRRPKNRRKVMQRAGTDEGSRKTKLKNYSCDNETTIGKVDRSSDSESDNLSISSEEDAQSTSSEHKEDRSWLHNQVKRTGKHEKRTNYELAPNQPQHKFDGFGAQQRTDLEDKSNNQGYLPTGTSFGARMSAFRKVTKSSVQIPSAAASQTLVFPLENAAAGESTTIGAKEMKKIEKEAKHKTKMEKKAIAEAKLTVSEAKLTEFEAKLRARQAHIDESHAKLCNRRAMIKRAEERIQMLEAQLDEEEECQLEKERKVKNRERRVKQEEDGYKIKLTSLSKREKNISDDLKELERRKQLAEERESELIAMENKLSRKENSRYKYSNENRIYVPMTVEKTPDKKSSKENTNNYASLGRKKESRGRSRQQNSSSNHKGVAPIPTPRKSLEGKESLSAGRKKRSNSLDSETMLGEEESSRSGKQSLVPRQEKYQVGSLPRRKNKYAISGLWL